MITGDHKVTASAIAQQIGILQEGDQALEYADIGIAMGITGTDVAKDAANMVLTDDNFATIIKAINNGRSIHGNIENAVRFLLSGNTSGILAVVYTSIVGLRALFSPVHLLFINLLTDSLPAIAIGLEPAHSGLMKEKPRNDAPLSLKTLWINP